MKKLLILLTVFTLTGCENFMSMKTNTVDLPENVTSLKSAYTWIGNNIKYRSDNDAHGCDYWQSPESTLECGTGDCDDFAILFAAFADKLGYDSEIAVVYYNNDKSTGHALTKLGDNYYDSEPTLTLNGEYKACDFKPEVIDFTVDYTVNLLEALANCDKPYSK